MSSLESASDAQASLKSCVADVLSRVVAATSSRFKTMTSVARDVVGDIIKGTHVDGVSS